ncbi:MAG: arsenate reductase (glutaredoxin) [Rhodobacteraceae bacterium]|nr:arsenate reductase (glutaredoxin) [Paracoccaceae bacterium]
MKPQIWHNPRCSKSRQTLELLKANGVEPEIILYKDNAPSEADIRAVLEALGKAPIELIRQNDEAFKTLGLTSADDDTLIKAMAEHPAIIERPVVRNNTQAALGRPPEDVLKLFE